MTAHPSDIPGPPQVPTLEIPCARALLESYAPVVYSSTYPLPLTGGGFRLGVFGASALAQDVNGR